jgi:serine/threonine-protein kinase
MGEVYLVEHPRLPRRNALKVLPADVSADPEYRTRLIREADLAATLYHPHIVGMHDRGEFNGQLWISMDFVDGLDAAQLLAQRYPVGMPVDEVVRIVTAVASALDYAHKQGLLHRDVKPANIMLTHLDDSEEQRILLADFGIARNVDDISGLTPTNMAVGTVAYAAPEQLMGEEEIDGRADQYALAATAYHLLTGARLFPHSNPAVVISRHLNSPPPTLAEMRPDLAALDRALAIALAKDPQDRFSRCTDFAYALAEARINVGNGQHPRDAPPPYWWWLPTRFIASPAGVVIDGWTLPPKPPPQAASERATTDTKSARDTEVGPTVAAARMQSEPDYAQRTRLPRRRSVLAAALATILITVILGVWQPWRQRQASIMATPPPVSASTTTHPPPLVEAPPLDGTYRMDFDGSRDTINGQPYPISDNDPLWLGFRYTCTPTACVAMSTGLDPHNLSAPGSSPPVVFHWTGQIWQVNLTEVEQCSGPNGESHEQRMRIWSLTPGADHGYIGTVTTRTTSDECDNEGDVHEYPFTLRRTGPVPSGIVPDPPIDSASTPSLAPPPITNPPASATVVFGGRQLNTSGLLTCGWIHGQLDISIGGPGTLVVAQITATQVQRVNFNINDTPFFYQRGIANGATASISHNGKRSYTVTGLVSSPDPAHPGWWMTEPFRLDVTCS